MNTDRKRQITHVDLPKEFCDLMESIPNGKRVEVVFARHSDDCEIRGTNQNLRSTDI